MLFVQGPPGTGKATFPLVLYVVCSGSSRYGKDNKYFVYSPGTVGFLVPGGSSGTECIE